MNKNTLLVGAIILVLIISGVSYFASSKTAKSPELSSKTTLPSATPTSIPTPTPTLPEDTMNSGGFTKETSLSAGKDPQVKEFTVVALNFKYQPTEIKVKKGDKVKITFQNAEGFHDWVLDEFSARTKKLQTGGQEVLEFTADKTGAFEFYCSVGSHRQMGMVGKFIVE